MTNASRICALIIFVLSAFAAGGCTSARVTSSPAFTVANGQQMLPILPFSTILVPDTFSALVFNDFVDSLNDNPGKSGFTWFAIIKEDIEEVGKILPQGHIYLAGEIWSLIENAGCCSTELRVKSKIRIYRVGTKEMLWEAEIPLESFFEHDASTLSVEREKLALRLSQSMTKELLKALETAKRIQYE